MVSPHAKGKMMPSIALSAWFGSRMISLEAVDIQCAAVTNLPTPDPTLLEENLRGYVLPLSAHFQGFCRDLHTECAQFVGNHVDSRIQVLVQQSFVTPKLALDHGNPNKKNINADFNRFGLTLNLEAAHPRNQARLSHLGELNKWRNAAAHHGVPPRSIRLDLQGIRKWKISCSDLAGSLDDRMYNHLIDLIVGPTPWTP